MKPGHWVAIVALVAVAVVASIFLLSMSSNEGCLPRQTPVEDSSRLRGDQPGCE